MIYVIGTITDNHSGLDGNGTWLWFFLCLSPTRTFNQISCWGFSFSTRLIFYSHLCIILAKWCCFHAEL